MNLFCGYSKSQNLMTLQVLVCVLVSGSAPPVFPVSEFPSDDFVYCLQCVRRGGQAGEGGKCQSCSHNTGTTHCCHPSRPALPARPGRPDRCKLPRPGTPAWSVQPHRPDPARRALHGPGLARFAVQGMSKARSACLLSGLSLRRPNGRHIYVTEYNLLS